MAEHVSKEENATPTRVMRNSQCGGTRLGNKPIKSVNQLTVLLGLTLFVCTYFLFDAKTSTLKRYGGSKMSSIMRMQQVSKQFGSKQVLKSIDLDLQPGHIVGLVGGKWCR